MPLTCRHSFLCMKAGHLHPFDRCLCMPSMLVQINNLLDEVGHEPVHAYYRALKSCACCDLASELFTQWLCVTVSGECGKGGGAQFLYDSCTVLSTAGLRTPCTYIAQRFACVCLPSPPSRHWQLAHDVVPE